MEAWVFVAALLGSAGLGGLISALTNALLATKRAPLEEQKLKFEGQLVLSDAAANLVQSQNTVVEARDLEIERLTVRVSQLEQTLQRVLDELEEERKLREEREHELETHRMELAKQAKTIRSLSAKIGAFKKALGEAGVNPEDVEIEEAHS